MLPKNNIKLLCYQSTGTNLGMRKQERLSVDKYRLCQLFGILQNPSFLRRGIIFPVIIGKCEQTNAKIECDHWKQNNISVREYPTRSFFFLSGVMKPFLAFLPAAVSSRRFRTSAFLRSTSARFCFSAYGPGRPSQRHAPGALFTGNCYVQCSMFFFCMWFMIVL